MEESKRVDQWFELRVDARFEVTCIQLGPGGTQVSVESIRRLNHDFVRLVQDAEWELVGGFGGQPEPEVLVRPTHFLPVQQRIQFRQPLLEQMTVLQEHPGSFHDCRANGLLGLILRPLAKRLFKHVNLQLLFFADDINPRICTWTEYLQDGCFVV